MKPVAIGVTIICILSIFAGCGSSLAPDNAAAQDSVDADSLLIEQFIDIKTEFAKGVVEAGDTVEFDSDISNDDLLMQNAELMNRLFFQYQYSQAAAYLALDHDGLVRDYYISAIVRDKVDQLPDYSEMVQQDVAQGIEDITDKSTPFLFPFYADSHIDITVIIERVAEKHGLTFEECTATIFEPFWTSVISNEYYRLYFNLHIYEGQIVEYDGTNDAEYAQCAEDLFHEYDAFRNGLYEGR